MDLKHEDQERPHVWERRLQSLENRCSATVMAALIDVILALDKRLDTVEERGNKPTGVVGNGF